MPLIETYLYNHKGEKTIKLNFCHIIISQFKQKKNWLRNHK